MTTATLVAMGYRSTREGDTLIVHDVPIFCNCERGEFTADAEWVAKAVTLAKQKEREGYLPPLHVRHHEAATSMTDSVRAAGFFRITHSGPLTLGGQRRIAIFADLLITDLGVQHDVIKLRYPYRSVEIFDVEGEPCIDSLALLDHEAPFLEMPMLAIKSVEEGEDPSAVPGFEDVALATFSGHGLLDARPGSSPVVASFEKGKRAALLFHSQEDETMADKIEAEVTEETTDELDPKGKNFAEDGEKKEDEDGENLEGAAVDVSAIVKAIESGDIAVKDMDAIVAAIQSQKSGSDVEETPEEAPAPAAAPGAESMKRDTETSSKFAKMQGKIEALEARDAARDDADQRTVEVSAAMKRLAGRPLGADLEARLVKFHKEHKSAAFNDYVEAMAQTAAPLPEDHTATVDFPQGVPSIAMKFSKLGTGAIDRAAQLSREYEQLKGTGIRASEESYVRVNMQREGFELAD